MGPCFFYLCKFHNFHNENAYSDEILFFEFVVSLGDSHPPGVFCFRNVLIPYQFLSVEVLFDYRETFFVGDVFVKLFSACFLVSSPA